MHLTTDGQLWTVVTAVARAALLNCLAPWHRWSLSFGIGEMDAEAESSSDFAREVCLLDSSLLEVSKAPGVAAQCRCTVARSRHHRQTGTLSEKRVQSDERLMA